MHVQSFPAYFARVRDHNLPMTMSWQKRSEASEFVTDDDHEFCLWSPVPVEALTEDDLIWMLVAAAMQPYTTHLHVYIQNLTQDKSCVHHLMALMQKLEVLGYEPADFDVILTSSSMWNYLKVSLFSEDEVNYADPEADDDD